MAAPERAHGRIAKAERRHELNRRSRQLLAPLRQPDSPLQWLDADRRCKMETVAAGCADLFQHSSSSV